MKIGRNDPCFCGSGKKYKKCCLTKADVRVDFQKKQFTIFFDLKKHLTEIYKVLGFARIPTVTDLAQKCNIQIRNNADWSYDSFCHIDHPLIYEIWKDVQFRTMLLGNQSLSNTFLLYFASCHALASQTNETWARHVLERISKIHFRDKDSSKHFSACLAEYEHIALLRGHALKINPLIPVNGVTDKTPESELRIKDKVIGVEVCSVASYFERSRMATQRLSEKLCKELQPHFQGKRLEITVPEAILEILNKEYETIREAIIMGKTTIPIDSSTIKLEYGSIQTPDQLAKPKRNTDDGIAVLIPGLENSAGQRQIFYNEGLQVIVAIERDDVNRVQKIKKMINGAVRNKIKQKQVDLDKYDYGLLAIRVPYEFFINNGTDLVKMKSEFNEYMTEAVNLIKHSSRYKGVLIFSASHEIKENERLTLLRGQLEELNNKVVGKKYLQVEVGAQAIFERKC